MRHLKSGRALGVKPAHRRAMMRNMVTSVLEHQQITTTLARAKEVRIPLEKMITLGKKGDLSARRRALAFIKSKAAMKNLFGEFAERYAERPGGYSRIIRLGNRRGDGALMAMVQLVDAPNDPFAEEKKTTGRRRGSRKKADKVIDKVAEKVSEEVEATTGENPPKKKKETDPEKDSKTEGKAPTDEKAEDKEDTEEKAE